MALILNNPNKTDFWAEKLNSDAFVLKGINFPFLMHFNFKKVTNYINLSPYQIKESALLFHVLEKNQKTKPMTYMIVFNHEFMFEFIFFIKNSKVLKTMMFSITT